MHVFRRSVCSVDGARSWEESLTISEESEWGSSDEISTPKRSSLISTAMHRKSASPSLSVDGFRDVVVAEFGCSGEPDVVWLEAPVCFDHTLSHTSWSTASRPPVISPSPLGYPNAGFGDASLFGGLSSNEGRALNSECAPYCFSVT